MKLLTNVVLCALFVACLAIRSVESQCQGATDESSLQAQLASPTSGSLITICSNINLTETLVIRAPTTVQGNCSSRCKISAALPRTVNQLVSVAPGTGPVFFRNLQLDGGLAESGETGTLLTGGAVLLSPSSTTTFTNVLFTNNAADEGGAVYSSSANATFVGCTFTSNTATASGGAFQAAGGSAVILSSTFQQNSAPLGGAVYLQQTVVPAVVRGSLFVGNQATTQQGGAIFVSVRAVNASIGGNTFASNTATVSGGAIHDDGASQNGAVVSTAFTVLSGNAFSQNTAPRGGAVSSNVAQTSFCNAQLFVNNVAPTGSNLFATGSEDSGDTKFCPTAPSDSTSGAFAADVGGVFASDCSYCNCGPNNPCDPNAVCTPGSRSGSGTNLTCACRSGFSGNGYVCLGPSNSSLLVGNTGASTSQTALASFTTSNSSVPSPGAAPSRAPAPAPVAAPAPSLVNGTLANSTTATAPSANATAPNGSLPNATGLNGTVPTATVRNGTAANGSLPANRTAPVPAPGPIAALAPGGAVIITNSSAPAPTNATGFAPAAGPSGNGSAVVVPLPVNATANGTVPAAAPSLNGTVPIPTNATLNISGPASAPLSAPPPRGTNASFPPPVQPNVTTSPPPPQGTNASFPPPAQPNVTTSPPPPAFPPPAPVATNASAPPPIVPNVTLAPPPPLPAATNATAPPPLEPNVTLAPPPPLPEATNATSPPPDSPPPAAPPPQSPPPNLPPPSLPPPGAPPPPQPTVPVIVTPNQGSPPPVSVPPPPAASPSPPAPTGGLLGGPAAPPPPVCSCPPGQAPGIGATATACNCNYPLTASYRLVDRNLQDWTPTFATSFTSDVAGLLGVQPSQILYTNVQQGSILLDTNVVPLSGATLDNATVTRISGALQQGQPLDLSESQYGQVLVTSVGLPAQLTSDPPSPSTGVTTPSGPTPSTSPGTTTTSSGGGGSNIGAIIGGVVGGVVFLAVVLAVLVALVKRKRRKHSLPPAAPPVLGARPPKSLERPLSARERAAGGRESGQLPTPGREDIADKALFGTFRRFGFPEVQQATDDFAQANLLGEGGFGMVYKGMFGDGTMLAVKLLKNTQQGQAESEFLSELGTLGRVRHRNLVALKGFCVSSEDCFLILDYAAGGNLDQALRNPTRPVLTWPQRMNIAVGAARGLSYLHNDCRPTIIHRDIKSANILLDADGEAEVADFGLSKLLDSGQTHQSTRVRGTYGYVAPEYAMYGQVTKKTDVYSFGVVLLELITGLKALDVSQSGERRTLTEWVLKRHQQPLTIIDPRLEGEYFREQAEKFISLALACINPSPERRPAMLDILRTLETLNPSGSVPASPLGSPERSAEMQDVYPSTSSDWSAGTGSGTRRTPLRPSSGGSGNSPVGTTSDWSQGQNSTILHNTTQYNMTGINEGR